MNAAPDNLDTALDAHAKGIAAIPCHVGTKIPKVRWKEWQYQLPSVEQLREWFREECNIAIVTTGMVLFDVDDPAAAGVVLRHCGDTPHKLRSPSGGIHLGYRRRRGITLGNKVRIKGLDIDVRTDGGIEVIPDSRTEKGHYQWLGGNGLRPINELPVARIGWLRERVKRAVKVAEPIDRTDTDRMTRRAAAWLEVVARANPAVSGQGGHNATFRAACKLTHYFGLDRDTAIRLLMSIYNPRCHPEWSLKEITHKVDDALKKRR